MDRYGNYYYHRGSGLWRSLRDGDFEESEVWDVLSERKDQSLRESRLTSLPNEHPNDHYASSYLPSAAKMVPQSSTGSGGAGSSSSAPRSIFTHQSAPVNIPNWSKVQKRLGRSESSKAPKREPWRNGSCNDDDEDDEDGDGGEEDDDDEEDDGKKLPPHEYIAMRLARSNISSFSVLEGVGRKLKGRDLSKVRNDVLTKTGFLESP